MTIEEKIAMRIKQLRTEQKLTQEELAWRANVDRTYMNHVENARRNISIQILERIINNGLEKSFSEFFNSKEFKGSL
jgi:transcriptional regulator with XRE-family HTH domain